MPRNDGKEDDRIMESLILCKYDIKNIMAFSSDQREITPLWTCMKGWSPPYLQLQRKIREKEKQN